MSREPIESFVSEEPAGKWGNPVAWTLLVVAGLVVLELTMRPGLAAPVMCAKFGWNDFRTALWLRRRDPLPKRGWICFWLYLASSIWKVVITSLVTMLAFAFALVVLERRAQPAPPGLAETGVVAVAGLILASLTLLAAVNLALWFRVRVWLDPAVNRSRVENCWPPRHFSANKVRRLLLAAFLALIMATFAMTFIVDLPDMSLTLAFCLGGAAVGGAKGVECKIVAEVPEECWPPDELAEERALDQDLARR